MCERDAVSEVALSGASNISADVLAALLTWAQFSEMQECLNPLIQVLFLLCLTAVSSGTYGQLDRMILEVSSNLGDSVIPRHRPECLVVTNSSSTSFLPWVVTGERSLHHMHSKEQNGKHSTRVVRTSRRIPYIRQGNVKAACL